MELPPPKNKTIFQRAMARLLFYEGKGTNTRLYF